MTKLDGSAAPTSKTMSVADWIDRLAAIPQHEFKGCVEKDIRLIDPKARGADEVPVEMSMALRSPEIVERWCHTLARMKKSTEMTLAAKGVDDRANRLLLEQQRDRLAVEMSETTDPELCAKLERQRSETIAKISTDRYHFLRWRAGALRFLTGVEERVTEANYVRRMHFADRYPSHITEERNDLAEALVEARRQYDRLETAIAEHQVATESSTTVGSFGRIEHTDVRPADVTLWSALTTND